MVTSPGAHPYPGLNVELKTEPLPYAGESGGHMPGEAGSGLMMGGGYEAGYPVSQYHAGGYPEDGRQWPGYHHHHAGAGAHGQGSPTQARYPYYDSR